MTDLELQELQDKLKTAEADKAKLQQQVDESSQVIEDMQKTIDEKSKKKTSSSEILEVTVDKKKYEIRVKNKIIYKGKNYSAQDIQNNKTVAAALVKIKASFMVAIEK